LAAELNAKLALEAIRKSQGALSALVSQQPLDSRSWLVVDGVLHRLQQAADEIHVVLRALRRERPGASAGPS